MGKAVGTALKVVGVVALAAVAVVAGPQIALVALSLGSSLLRPKPKVPQTSPENANRLFASIDTRTPRKIVFGRTAMATDIRDQEYTDNQGYFHRFVVVASHRVQAIEEIWFDDKRVWTAGGGVEGEAVGYLTVTPILEGSAANAINISGRMGASRRYTGCAYVHLRYKLTGNSKKSESPYAQSIPTRLTIRGKGALVYDPRLDSSAGGSGPQRANDQSTWAWSDSASRNPALQELWYELGWRINGKLAVGKGVPPVRLDLASYLIAANLCDEAVALAVGGSEPRYRSDGVFSEGDQPSLVRDNLKAAMNAVLDDMDGKIRLTVISNDLASPIADFTEADILDGVRWEQAPPLIDTFNVIRGSYTDPSDQSLYQQVDYPEITLASVDGIERIETVDLPLVQSPSQAQRLAKQRLQRMQYPGLFTANFQATAWRVQKGDVVRLTFPALGWLNKLFRAIDITVRIDGVVPMVLREEHASIYAWSASEAPAVAAASPTTYDWTKNPLYADIVQLEDGPPGPPGPPGASATTLIAGSPTTTAEGNSVRGTGGAWGADAAYSLEAYTGGAVAQFTFPAVNGDYAAAGLTVGNPGTGSGNGFGTITFALTRDTANKPQAYVDDTAWGPPGAAITGQMTGRVHFDGRYVRWYANDQQVGPAYDWMVGLYDPHDPQYALRFRCVLNADDLTVTNISLVPAGALGRDGLNAPLLLTQWSVNGSTDWHATFVDGDLYQRQSNNNGATWGAAVRVIGESADGADGITPAAVFKRAATVPATPPDNTGNPPTGWSDGPPAGAGFIWQSNAKFREAAQLTSWSAPQRISGEAGADGYTLAAAPAAVLVRCYANGTPKPDELPRNITINASKAGVDVSSGITLSASAGSGISVSTSGNVVTVASASNDGAVTVTVTQGSAVIGTAKVPVTRVLDPAPPQSVTEISKQVSNNVTVTSYGVETATAIMQAGPGGNLSVGLSGDYSASGSSSNRSVKLAGKLRYRIPGGSWSDIGAEVVDPGQAIASTGESEPSSLSIGQSVSGLPAGQAYEVEGYLRIASRSPGTTSASFGGVLTVTTS